MKNNWGLNVGVFVGETPQHFQTQSFFIPARLWRWNRQCVPKSWHVKFRRREITQKKVYNIQNMARVWNQEKCRISTHTKKAGLPIGWKTAEKSQVFSARANVFLSTFEPFAFRTKGNGQWSVPGKLSNSGTITLPFNFDQNPRPSKHNFAKCGVGKPGLLKCNMLHMSQ